MSITLIVVDNVLTIKLVGHRTFHQPAPCRAYILTSMPPKVRKESKKQTEWFGKVAKELAEGEERL